VGKVKAINGAGDRGKDLALVGDTSEAAEELGDSGVNAGIVANFVFGGLLILAN
jgi:hypothetical protein